MPIPPKPHLSHVVKAQNGNRTTPSDPRFPLSPVNLSAPAPKRTEVPFCLMGLEPRLPFAVFNDNPVFDVVHASRILGVSQELLEKWRQRGQGPDYIQYGPKGPVRYELSALEAHKAIHRVHVSCQPHRGSR
jgi:hypothetical protein